MIERNCNSKNDGNTITAATTTANKTVIPSRYSTTCKQRINLVQIV